MTIRFEDPPIREDLIRDLRTMAKGGATLAELVDEIPRRLEYPKHAVVPILAYLTRTFEFPLRVVLPLREWIFDRDDRQVADLIARIKEWREAESRSQLVQAASEGKLDELRCPQCECQTVSVFFTRPTPKEYHTWFVCSNCDFSMRAQNSGKPGFYTQERDRTGKKAVAASSDEKQ